MHLKRTGEGQVEITLRGAGNQGHKDILVQAKTAQTGEKDIRIKINQLTLADAMLFGTGTRHVAITGVPVSGSISMVGRS